MTERASFSGFYDQELHPRLEELEAGRKTLFRHLFRNLGITAGIAALVALLFAGMGGEPIFPAAAAAGLGVIVLIGYFYYELANYKDKFKVSVIGPIIRFVDPDLRYSPDRGIGEHEFKRSGLFRTRIDRYHSEDLVSGTLGKTAIRFSEVKAEYRTQSGKQTHWHTIFEGMFFIGDFNKHFRGRTLVLPDTAELLLGSFGQWLQSVGAGSKGELVKLEDPEFEENFVVYSSDQIEARYILSPALMRRLIDFAGQAGRDVHVGFVDSNVIVAISLRRDLFEPPVFGSVIRPGLAREYLGHVRLATNLVEDLNLNTRIWTKE